jgi:hypothetical protein
MGAFLWFIGFACICSSLFEKQVSVEIFSVGMGIAICLGGVARDITSDLTAEIKKLREG